MKIRTQIRPTTPINITRNSSTGPTNIITRDEKDLKELSNTEINFI